MMPWCLCGCRYWMETLENFTFPRFFRDYARSCPRRYNWVRLFSPINEMYVTARMSALEGVWNEQLRGERGFVTAIRNVALANVLATQAIRRERADAVFVNSESSEFYQPCCPDREIVRIADF